jgi:hypothetical protein
VREIVNKSEDYYSFKDPQTLHLNYGKVGVLNYTKNETKFRQYRCYQQGYDDTIQKIKKRKWTKF